MERIPDPPKLGSLLVEVISRRGLARSLGNQQIQQLWGQAAGKEIAAQTRVKGFSGGTLTIEVANSPLLSELVSFHHQQLLKQINELSTDQPIKNLKFKLNSGLQKNT